MKHCLSLLITLIALLTAPSVKAVALTEDSLHVSLITCGPGEEAYEVYGHTAIRIQNTHSGDDWAFNYGVFDFNQPHFLWRFVLGETDYRLGVVPFSFFVESYRKAGRSVEEDVLNLSGEEKSLLYSLLVTNYLPENCVYRYNFFDKNCTTQARDIIEKACNDSINYQSMPSRSYRDILHEFTAQHPWLRFGQDLLIGTEADRQLDARGQDFVPMLFQKNLRQASRTTPDGQQAPMVTAHSQILPQNAEAADIPFLTPMKVMTAWLLFAIGLGALQVALHRNWWWVDIPFIALQGLTGCLITFLFFFSEHPGVDSNWLIVVLNPLPLCYLPWEIRNAVRGTKDYYHFIAPIVIWGFTVLHPLTGQDIPTEALIYINGLAVLSVARILSVYRTNKHE